MGGWAATLNSTGLFFFSMTKKEFINELVWKFDLKLSDAGERILDGMLDKYKPIVFVEKKIFENDNHCAQREFFSMPKNDWANILSKACLKFGTDVEKLITPSKTKRSAIKSMVFTWICRYAKTRHPKITTTYLGRKLKINHRTVMYYWYASKSDCDLLPFPTEGKHKALIFQKGYLKKVA